ncbi:sensor domain-containing diguanylate cyclase [Psychrobacillus sp.]|uniref:sensor domain-containing diguanylate cyclase n=1 Tax=Psychrobacillus sp. TaxID=1871623 RepID=UPI0028BDBD4A|nr:sensor domain-containing diguanylate cyclase [Psychrobacillus sp.]
MDLNEALLLLLTHGLPILFLTYMAADLLLRNKRKTEHILLSLIAFCFLLLFAEEFVRNQVSIEYSPLLSSLWLISVGLIIPGLCFHFLIKFTGLHTNWPRFLYPYIFYVPLIFGILNIFTGGKLVSTQDFFEVGMWKYPIYNESYYIAITVGTIIDILYLIPLLIAKSKAKMEEQRAIYQQLIVAVYVAIILNIVLGYFPYENMLPPNLFIYAGIVWCYFLRRIMKQHDFLNLYDKRYEKLFRLNPDAILLLDFKGIIHDANPAATKLLDNLNLRQEQLFALLDDMLKEQLLTEKEIKDYALSISNNDVQFLLLVNADYILVDNQMHILLILQDVTLQKQYQREIEFLAYHDTLTRLPNRRLFNIQLEAAMETCRNEQQTLTLLLIDIDSFKSLNDTYGHQVGDELLQVTAQILQDAVKDTGDVARLGGDEFVLFLRDVHSKQLTNQFIEQLQSTFSQHITTTHPDLPISLSVGISQFPEDGEDGQTLMHHADQAMYAAKRSFKFGVSSKRGIHE